MSYTISDHDKVLISLASLFKQKATNRRLAVDRIEKKDDNNKSFLVGEESAYEDAARFIELLLDIEVH